MHQLAYLLSKQRAFQHLLQNFDSFPQIFLKNITPPTSSSPQAERARLEALASFGGTDLASVAVKKRDLREELQRDVKLMEQGENKQNRVKRRSRLDPLQQG